MAAKSISGLSLQSPITFPANHKTVFVLDHTPYFGLSCDIQVEFGFAKARPGLIPLKPISKSLWTCSVEAAIEYSRVTWDLFPEGKLIRFVISDNHGRVLNSWAPDQQNIYRILGCLSGCGAPPRLTATNINTDYSIIHGFRPTIESLCECSDVQHIYRTSIENRSIINNCRVICITSARDNESIRNLEDIFLNELMRVNKISASSNHMVPVNHCYLIIINTFPNAASTTVTGHPRVDLSPILTTEAYNVAGGNKLANKMAHLLLDHYNLGSTTITGIPMKEEQNANSSANYDVEIFHCKEAHTLLLHGKIDLTGIRSVKPGNFYETMTLRWCTPRGSGTPDLNNCTTLHRITPVEVNSRPSACLISFLLNGRTVMLESLQQNERHMTHMLTSYGGEIFIQTLSVARNSIFEDIPSISEVLGSAVTDYRTEEFEAFIKMHKLLPLKRRYFGENNNGIMEDTLPLDKTIMSIEKHTKIWPLTYSSSIIFSMKKEYVEPLLTLILKEQLMDEDVLKCKLCILNLIYLEVCTQNPVPISVINVKRVKYQREDHFKYMWSELESYITTHNYSDNHQALLMCLRECRKKNDVSIINEKQKIELLLKGLEHDKEQMLQRGTVIRATTDSPLSPPMVMNRLQRTSATSSASSSRAVSPALCSLSSLPNLTSVFDGIKTLAEVWIQRNIRKECFVKFPPYAGIEPYEELEDGAILSKVFPNLPPDSESDDDDNNDKDKRNIYNDGKHNVSQLKDQKTGSNVVDIVFTCEPVKDEERYLKFL